MLKMKLFYGIVLVLMLLVSACAQQPAQPEAQDDAGDAMEGDAGDAMEDDTADVIAEPETTSEEIRVLGSGGIEPLEVTISAGSSVTWMYEADIVSVLTIQKDGASFANSPLLKAGDKFEQEFAEAGEYTYFAVSYGPQGAKIIVE